MERCSAAAELPWSPLKTNNREVSESRISGAMALGQTRVKDAITSTKLRTLFCDLEFKSPYVTVFCGTYGRWRNWETIQFKTLGLQMALLGK